MLKNSFLLFRFWTLCVFDHLVIVFFFFRVCVCFGFTCAVSFKIDTSHVPTAFRSCGPFGFSQNYFRVTESRIFCGPCTIFNLGQTPMRRPQERKRAKFRAEEGNRAKFVVPTFSPPPRPSHWSESNWPQCNAFEHVTTI